MLRAFVLSALLAASAVSLGACGAYNAGSPGDGYPPANSGVPTQPPANGSPASDPGAITGYHS